MTSLEEHNLSIITRAFSALVQDEMIGHILLNEEDYLWMFTDIKDAGCTPKHAVAYTNVYPYTSRMYYTLHMQLYTEKFTGTNYVDCQLSGPIVVTGLTVCINECPGHNRIIYGTYNKRTPLGNHEFDLCYNTGIELTDETGPYRLATFLIEFIYADIMERNKRLW